MDYKEKVIALLDSKELSQEQKEKLEEIFPELKESEGEKIRKYILKCCEETIEANDRGLELSMDTTKKLKTWLEKQGEHANFLDKIQIGDKVTRNEDGALVNLSQLNRVAKPTYKDESKFKVGDWVVCEAAPRYTAFKTGDVVQISSKETLKIFLMFKDCFRPWAIQDAKCCDILVDDLGNICIYQEPSTNLMYHSFCYGNHKHFIDGGGSHKIVGTCPATKEQSDTLMKAMADAGYTFDFEKKELRKLEPKSSEWREEDKELMKWSINNLTELKDRFGEEYGKVGDCINWLKSLKPQTKQDWSQNDIDMIDWLIRCCENEHEELCNDKYGHQDIVSDLKRDCRKKWDWLESLKNRVVPQSKWKPSDKQMKALGVATNISNVPEKEYQELEKLYQDLKKLRDGK